ncbi:MAG: 3',5'-cyclic-nucleotide phosphodiesterase [Gammaproteobacteria bacterium]|nr:3',5'-cyclic-nucleotide phosphodiesterase [Gammaproteobacteria bacterium]MBU1415800.1 3',5'-cyclic-nucleotide phosphodiesterase [Gammaproteobacteria bacterium]
MKVRILGCSGGIGGPDQLTTSLLVDQDILIDCGTGVGDLSLEELARIDHLFVTHSHLDHIACLPLLIDTVCDMRGSPLMVHATAATIDTLRSHIFNWAVWPDFSAIPSAEESYLRFAPLRVGEVFELDGRRVTALPADHTVPAVGYHLDSGVASLVFTGDTGPCPELWTAVNAIGNLRTLIIETAFSNREAPRANISKHLCPDTLAKELEMLAVPADIFITHLKPGQSEVTMREIEERVGPRKPGMLRGGQVFTF